MNCVIIDNEPRIIEGLKYLLTTYCPVVQVTNTANDIASGKKTIEAEKPELLFLDIELGQGTGLELLDKLTYKDFQLIFITAYDKYAVQAFRFSAIDYLLKPIDPDDLVQAVERCQKNLAQKNDLTRFNTLINNLERLSNGPNKIIVSDRENIFALDIQQILYFKADGAYTHIRTNDSHIMASKNLKHFEELLLPIGFYRVHHSYLSNLRKMVRYDKQESILELNNGEKIPVSSRRKEGLIKAMKEQML